MPHSSQTKPHTDAEVPASFRALIGFEADGNLQLGNICPFDNLTSCGAANINAVTVDYTFNYGLEFTTGNEWLGNQTASLGCLYVTGPSVLTIPADGWNVGLHFLDTEEGTYSKMSKPLFTESYPQLATVLGAYDLTPSCRYSTVNVRMPLGDSQEGTCQVCTNVSIRQVDYKLTEVSRY